MYTTILSIQGELEKARERLKDVEENIKKNIGRDVISGPGGNSRPGFKRASNRFEEDTLELPGKTRKVFLQTNDVKGRFGGGNFGQRNSEAWPQGNADTRSRDHDFRGRGARLGRQNNFGPNQNFNNRGRPEEKGPEERISVKKRLGEQQAITVFSRLSGPPKDEDFEEETGVNKMPSQVIVQELPSRKEVLAAQSGDNQCKERNKRMFGALLGTLQKFRQEENKLKEKEEKRAQVERRLEEAAQREKEEARKARQELFSSRRQQQMEIRQLEYKLLRIKQLSEWEATKIHLLNFIQTKTTPKIFFLPKTHNTKSEDLLATSRAAINKMIEDKRAEVERAIAEHVPDLNTIKSEPTDYETRRSRVNNNNDEDEKTPDDEDDDGEITSKTEEMILDPEEPVSDKENMTVETPTAPALSTVAAATTPSEQEEGELDPEPEETLAADVETDTFVKTETVAT